MEAQHPSEIELGLERVNQVKQRLNIQFSCPVITIAGTNGKGTTVRALEVIAQANGKSVGSLTSPHIFRFNERIKINQLPVDDTQIIAAASLVHAHVSEIPLTYFEICVLLALIILSDSNLDLVVLEVGLGGRLDAVNIIDADISIVTHIGLDHVDFLGDSLEKIGFEKAGIMRHKQETVLGRDLPMSVRTQAKKLECCISTLGQEFDISEQLLFTAHNLDIAFDDLQLHADSVALAITAFSKIAEIKTHQTKVGLEKAILEGRWERISGHPSIIADVSHNPDAFGVLEQRIKKDCSNKELVCIVGMCADKDIKASLAQIAPYVSKWLVCDLKIARAIMSAELKSLLVSIGVKNEAIRCVDSPKKALEESKLLDKYKNKDTVLLITGSFYTVSEAFT
jgi:dihydrofolate synthase / folylpolyglutamate synthase